MNESVQKNLCPECGLELPAGTASFGCPGCSLRLALSPDDSPSIEPSTLPGLKSRFMGDYELLDEIARGGMGVVYRARQLGLNRLVALKMVQSNHLLSEEARLRFRVEIEAVAQLHHPHIVSLYESGEHDGAHYFTMRLVEGGDLSARLKENWPLRERIKLLIKVCRAVHYAHQRGILHRDLKPSNILVDQQGEPHVADFGLAKSLDQDTGFTFTASVLGSPNYMAPEQAAGKTRQLTTAVDVYGLGAILYHLIAGRPPFQARTPIATLRQVLDNDPESLRSLSRETDADLETIALKCLRKEPAARYGTAEELAQDLERWLAGQPILARPLGPIAMTWRWSRRHPVAAVLGVALAMAIAAIAVGTGVAAMRIRRAETKADNHLRESLLREASSWRSGGELGHRTETLRLIKEAAALGGSLEFRMQLRNELLATLARTELEFVPTTNSNLPSRAEWNGIQPRFDLVANVEHGTNVVFRALADGEVRGRLVLKNHPITHVDAFSPNGRYLALRREDFLSIWDLKTGKRCFTNAGATTTFAFHPREDAILVQPTPNRAVWIDLPSGAERFDWSLPLPRPAGRTNGWHTLVFSPDGRTLAGASGTSPMIELMEPQTGTPLGWLTNYTGHPIAIAWSGDGALLASATYDGRINLFETVSRNVQWTSPAMVVSARSLAFHPRGNWLAAACDDGKVRLIDVVAERFVYEHAGKSHRIAFSPDGDKLGPLQWRDQSGYLRFRRPREFTAVTVGSRYFRLDDVRFSTDGKMFAAGHSDEVLIFDSERLSRLRRRDEWRMSATLFHPNGRDLLIGETQSWMRLQPYFAAPNRLLFGTGEVIRAEAGWQAFGCSPDGQFFAAFNVRKKEASVFDHTLTNRLATVVAPADTSSVSISTDGRWLTTCSRRELGVKVWNTAEERFLFTVLVGIAPRSAFSSDGRWLAVNGEDKFQLLEVGSWKPVSLPSSDNERKPILSAAAFSADSRWLAVVADRFTVHLFDLQSFSLLGVLRPPISASIRALAFSPDGSKLVAVGTEARVAVWNLSEIKKSLDDYGLAWSR